MTDVKVHIGTIEDMGQRFVDAWHRAERGERVNERHLTFPDLPALLAGLSVKRLELLNALHDQPARSVADLARTLGRDYKRVYEDVAGLAMLGLIERNEEGVRITVDEIQASFRFGSRAAAE